MSRRAKRPILFKKLRKVQCPACLDRNALGPVGRPLFVRGVKLSGGCEICGGKGEVTEGILVGDYYQDPWVLKSV